MSKKDTFVLALLAIVMFLAGMGTYKFVSEAQTVRYDEWGNQFDYYGGLVKRAPCDMSSTIGYFNPLSCPAGNVSYYYDRQMPITMGWGL